MGSFIWTFLFEHGEHDLIWRHVSHPGCILTFFLFIVACKWSDSCPSDSLIPVLSSALATDPGLILRQSSLLSRSISKKWLCVCCNATFRGSDNESVFPSLSISILRLRRRKTQQGNVRTLIYTQSMLYVRTVKCQHSFTRFLTTMFLIKHHISDHYYHH